MCSKLKLAMFAVGFAAGTHVAARAEPVDAPAKVAVEQGATAVTPRPTLVDDQDAREKQLIAETSSLDLSILSLSDFGDEYALTR